MDGLVRFFKPDPGKAGIFFLFAFISFGAHVQTWAFSGKDMGIPKPPLYDLLETLPLWILWVLLALPLILLSGLISALAPGFAVPGWVFWPANLVYFYILSCAISSVFGSRRPRRRKHR